MNKCAVSKMIRNYESLVNTLKTSNLMLNSIQVCCAREALEHLRVEENIVRELIDRNKIACYSVKDEELVCRSELKKTRVLG